MTSARRLFANRANARQCTGPKTSAGKERSSRNGWRHGLQAPASYDVRFAGEIERFARLIAGDGATCERHACASRIAAAQFDLKQIRDARHALLVAAGPDILAAIADRNLLTKLTPLNRYEQRALARRRFAVRDFDRIGRDERRQAKNKPAFFKYETNG